MAAVTEVAPEPVHRARAAQRPVIVSRRRQRRIPATAAALVVAAAAFALRIYHVGRAYDLFVDEVSYTKLATSVATGHGLVLNGQGFTVHPPGQFYIWALAIRALGLHGSIQTVLLGLRPEVALTGALVCVAAYLLVRKAANETTALCVTAILAVDPFIQRFDGRVMLEAPAQLAATSAILCIATLASGPSRRRRHSRVHQRRQTTWIVLAGLATAWTLCTKDTFGLVLMLTLVAIWASGWILPRRVTAEIGALALAVYAIVIVTVGHPGSLSSWFSTQVTGVERVVGIRQISGFNSATVHVSLLNRVGANVGQFGMTYALLFLGGLTVPSMLWRTKAWRRRGQWAPGRRIKAVIALWGLSAGAYLAYAIVFGSLEEQMFYILGVPLVANLAIWVADTRWIPRRRVMVSLLLVAVLAVDLVVWANVRTTRDDEYRQLLAWAPSHIPNGSVVSVTDDTAQFLLRGFVLGQWATLESLRVHHVDYVLVSTSLVAQGYGVAAPAFLTFLEHDAPVVYAVSGRSEGSLRLYDVRALTGGSR